MSVLSVVMERTPRVAVESVTVGTGVRCKLRVLVLADPVNVAVECCKFSAEYSARRILGSETDATAYET
jgi:hypothetical protein